MNKEPMHILVTGGNGLLGHNVIERLLNENHIVHAIVRRASGLCIEHPRLKVFEGSFLQHEALRRAAAGCLAIIHMAAVTDMGLLRYADYAKVTVDGSRNVLFVASELNIRNLIYISTINTIGYGTPEKWAVESDPMKYPVTDSFYARSKKEAERLFIDASQKENMHVVILNPSFMLGKYDVKPSSGQLVLFGYRKALMLVPKGGKSFVHVRDVAAAVIAALEKGRNGEKYILSTQSMTIGEFYELQKTVCGYRQRIVRVPDRLLMAVGKAGDVLRKCGIRTQISTTNVRQICVCEYYDNSKAVSELDFAGTPIAEAVRDSIAWFRETKKIK